MFKQRMLNQCRYVMFKGAMTKWPVQKLTQGTTQKLLQHQPLWQFCLFCKQYSDNLLIRSFYDTLSSGTSKIFLKSK